MADTIRQKIMSAIDSRLKAILITGDYETDIGESVFDWKTEALSEADLPAVIYRDLAVETAIENFVGFMNRMAVEILVVCTDATPMAEVRKMIADVDKAIGTDLTWGGVALTTERIGDESEVVIQERKFAGCRISITVIYRNLAWNDYTTV